ncbi:MAG: LLM class flavin-dependent oxidoreductase [Actinobacteria bacterium]|nr:LLM class flavin-dependent oxidoreductase [Actinomycetota bacterium]
MRFGISFASHLKAVEVLPVAEELGYDVAWFYDTPAVNSDPFVVMAMCAGVTKTMQLGLGVAIPHLRMPHVLGTAMGTLGLLAPGRILLGFGTGFTGALSIGTKPTPWAVLADHLQVARGWMAGEEVEMTVKGVARPVRHLHPDKGYINVTDTIPIYVSCVGPKGIAVTGDLADGFWTLSVDRRPDPELIGGKIAEVQKRAAARGAGPLPSALITAVAVQGDGEPLDSDRLRSFLGPWVTTYFHSMHAFFAEDGPQNRDEWKQGSQLTAEDASPRLKQAAQQYFEEIVMNLPAEAPWITQHTGHSTFVRPEEEKFITADLIDLLSIVGPAEQVIAEIRALEEAGLSEIVWQVVPGHEDEVERFGREVIAPYRERYGS